MENVSCLKGKILSHVEQVSDERLVFVTPNGTRYEMFHEQDCCEHVYIESIEGDLNDLIGSTLLIAEEVSDSDFSDSDVKMGVDNGLQKWTFYKFATLKGYVTIRWFGASNGYYGVDVTFKQLTNT